MQTNILSFLLYSLISVMTVYMIPDRGKKYALLVYNILFYLLCDAKFLLLMLFGIGWSYYCGKIVSRNKNKLTLITGIMPIIGILSFFKYYNFFVPESKDILWLMMPLGISYYTFKIISYMVDSYNGKIEAGIKWVDYVNYISFFPQIICGPISRPKDMLEQISNFKNNFKSTMLEEGILLIVSGLFKKLVIADRLSIYVNSIFEGYEKYPALALWMAAFFYTIQIYCDFAGYSEIVIGICNLFGIECKSNFKLPYFSYSIRDFWGKWHISLSSWLRDYVYIPLGGNRKGNGRRIVNTLVTFFVSGIWHGNTLPFVIWGMYHGVFNLLSIEKSEKKWKRVSQMLINFIIVMFGWILFKCRTIEEVIGYVWYMFKTLTINVNVIIESVMPFTGDYSCLAYLLSVCIFIAVLFVFEYREFNNRQGLKNRDKYMKIIVYTGSIILFGVIGQNSFLYANF